MRSNAAGGDASPVECSRGFYHGLLDHSPPVCLTRRPAASAGFPAKKSGRNPLEIRTRVSDRASVSPHQIRTFSHGPRFAPGGRGTVELTLSRQPGDTAGLALSGCDLSTEVASAAAE